MAARKPRLYLITIVATLVGFSTAFAEKAKLEKLPADLGDDGLVIMQIAPHSKWRDAEVRLSNGKKGRAYDGFFVRKLRPGRYTIESVKRLSGFDSDAISTSTYYAILKINREFEIKPGKVTHLGLQYLLEDPENDRKNGAGQFFAIAFDNKGSEHAFLSEYYPHLAANLTPDDVFTAPHDYANEKLPIIRETLVQLALADALRDRKNGIAPEGIRGRHAVEISESNYIVGDLGLIARAGANQKLQYLAIDSVDRIAQVKYSRGDPWFFTRAGDVYRLVGDRVQKVSSKPADFLPTNGAMLSRDAVVFSDRQFSFLVSLDQGESWTRSDAVSVKQKQSLGADFNVGIDHMFAIADDRAVILSKSAIAAIDRSTGAVTPFGLPKNIAKDLSSLFETEAGVFALALNPNKSARLFHKPVGSNEWLKNQITKNWHCTVTIPDKSGKEIVAKCGYGELVSRDYGKTWQNRQTARLSVN